MSKFFFPTILLYLVFCHSGIAQNEERISATFRVLSWKGVISDIYYFDAGQRVDLKVPNGGPSRPLKYTGSPQLTFYRQGPVDASGKLTNISVATTRLVASGQDLILLFTKADEDNQQYNLIPITSSLLNSTNSGYLVFNLSPFEIAGKAGEQQFKLEPKESMLLEPKKNENGNFGFAVALKSQLSETSDWKLAYSSFWGLKDGRKSLVFITNKGNRREKIQVRKFHF